MMMVVVSGRAFITTSMRVIRRDCIVMINLAAWLGNVRTSIHTARIGTDNAEVQPNQRAKNHQPCENHFHQVGGDSVGFIANSRINSADGSDRRSCFSGFTR